MHKKGLTLLLLLVIAVTLAGCATIIHGKLQELSVITDPSGAIVIASDGQELTTPAILELDRSRSSYNLHIEKSGYKSVDIHLNRNIDPWFWGNILAGGIIGIAVDLTTGSAYKFSPDTVYKVLQRNGMSSKKLEGKSYLFIVLKEECPELDLSKLKKIN